MQNGNDIYPPFSFVGLYPLIAISLLALFMAIRVFGGMLLKKIALRSQMKALEHLKKDRPRVINEALQKIDQIEYQYKNAQILEADAATQLSYTVRSYYDQLMNHRTMTQSKDEIVQRNLQKLGVVLHKGYPAEFSGGTPTHSLASDIFSVAREVITACR